jgi:AAA15 family ATPase/GTPase
MINFLNIKNYRNLKSLHIKSLNRINLIIGKNNTGKSSILECIALYVTNDSFRMMHEILFQRGEIYSSELSGINRETDYFKALSSLFTNRKISFDIQDAIFINDLSLRFAKFLKQSKDTNTSIKFERLVFKTNSELKAFEEDTGIYLNDSLDTIGFEINKSNNDVYRFYEFQFQNRDFFRVFPRETESLQIINSTHIDRKENEVLWGKIALTEKELYIIEALKIIEPSIERLAFVGENKDRNAVVKLNNINHPLPLRSMGDGINRILTIILALVNSENGYLLIDEFENGLHYSVQEKLWEIIFYLSERLNIQVFATTHSRDCIEGFESVLNNSDNKIDGKLIRLENINGDIEEVEFDAHELKIATNENIEVR